MDKKIKKIILKIAILAVIVASLFITDTWLCSSTYLETHMAIEQLNNYTKPPIMYQMYQLFKNHSFTLFILLSIIVFAPDIYNWYKRHLMN